MSEANISEVPEVQPQPPTPLWLRRLSSILLIVFCSELGLFLLIYPWTDWWTENYFGALLREGWNNSYLRGAVSGVGLVNVWIAVAEVFHLFSRR